MTAPGMIPIVPVGRSFQRWRPNAAPTRSLGRAVALGQDTGLADARSHAVSELLQPLRDERAGASLLEAELGVLMQVAPGGDERGAVDRRQRHSVVIPGMTDTTDAPRTPRISAGGRCTRGARAGSGCGRTRSTCRGARAPSGRARSSRGPAVASEIGRASCRERV